MKNRFAGTNLYPYLRTIILKDVKKTSKYYAECYVEYMKEKHGNKIIYNLIKIFSNSDDSLLKYRIKYVTRIEDDCRSMFTKHSKEFNKLLELHPKCKNKELLELIKKNAP